MALTFEATGYAIKRESVTVLSSASDLTIMLWVRLTTTPAAAMSGMFWKLTNAGGTGYFFLGTTVAANNASFRAVNGVDPDQSLSGPQLLPKKWYHLALTYNATTHVLTCYVDGVLIGTMTLNMSALVLNREYCGDDGTGYAPLTAIAYLRQWTAVLTQAEIFAEMPTQRATRIANLFMDAWLIANYDLTDKSGNGHDWTNNNADTLRGFSVAKIPTTFTDLPGNISNYQQTHDVSGPAASSQLPPDRIDNGGEHLAVYNERWFRYVPPPGVTFVYFAAGPTADADPQYTPNMAIWVRKRS